MSWPVALKARLSQGGVAAGGTFLSDLWGRAPKAQIDLTPQQRATAFHPYSGPRHVPIPPSRTEDPDSVTLPPEGWFRAQIHTNRDIKPLVTPPV